MSAPRLRLQSVSRKDLRLDALFGPAGVRTSDGFGGWKVVDRPRKRSMTEWMGPQPMRASVQLLFDGWSLGRNGKSVTGDLKFLQENFAPTNGAQEPPPFRVIGAWPLLPSTHWVCDGLTFDDDAIVRPSDRVAVRALVTLSLLQFVPGDVIVKTSAAKRSKAAKPAAGKTRTYTVRAGDTLSGIAAKQLGDYRKAAAIAKLNGLRDPKRLTVGQKLRLP